MYSKRTFGTNQDKKMSIQRTYSTIPVNKIKFCCISVNKTRLLLKNCPYFKFLTNETTSLANIVYNK